MVCITKADILSGGNKIKDWGFENLYEKANYIKKGEKSCTKLQTPSNSRWNSFKLKKFWLTHGNIT